jgi:hypothetical protein
LDPQARKPDVSCVNIVVRLTPMGARRTISNTGSATVLGLTLCRAWRGDGDGVTTIALPV